MSTGVVRENSIFGLEVESTEGTFVAPSAVTSYLQVLPGIDWTPKRELVERSIITGTPGVITPRMGMKSVGVSIPVEMRAAGTEGTAPDWDKLLKSALGARRQISTTTTTKTGNTTTVLQIQDADISKFNVGDIILIKQSGAYEARPITAKSTGVGTATITVGFAFSGTPSNAVVIAKASTYYTTATGHISLSPAFYIGNEIRQAAMGCKVTQMALQNWSVGKLASMNFNLEGMNFTEINGAAPHTPTYDTGLPPLILQASVYRSGVLQSLNNFGFSLSNTLGWVTDTASANGRVTSKVRKREIQGSFNPYKDDTTVTNFDDWVAGTEFSLFAVAFNPSSTSGEVTMGSLVAFWFPQCVTTGYKSAEVDGIVADDISFQATRGTAGTSEEMYVGII